MHAKMNNSTNTLSIIVVRCCDFSIEIFSLHQKNKYIPHNGCNIGNYEDYKHMCVACEGYYIKQITQEEYNNLLKVCENDKLYHVHDDILPTTDENTIAVLIEEVFKIKNNYQCHVFNHNFNWVDYDDLNEDNCYIMYVHVEV